MTYSTWKKIPVYLALICILVFNNITAYSSSNEFDTAYARVLQEKLSYLKNAYGLVGISAAVEVPGQGTWLGTAGISETNVNLTTDMVFDVGSTTKSFIAALTLQLMEEDSLSLNDTIGKWLPQYLNINNKVTIKQLLNHTSGIYNFTDNQAWANAINQNLSRMWTLEEVMQGYVLAPYFQPGASWHYSNTNFVLLAIIITRITHTDLSGLFHARFFNPLGMNESYIELEDTINSPFVHNWVLSGGNLVDAYGTPRTAFTSSTMGAGGVITRPENMLRWLRALFSGNILTQNSRNLMLTFVNANISGANGYGLGTMRYNVNGKICWGHAGNSFGHSSVSMYYPVDSVSVSLMMNIDINTGALGIDFMNTVLSHNPIGINSFSNEIPETYRLYQNYPNPFNPETRIKFQLPETGNVKLIVYDALGRQVKVLIDKEMKAGNYETQWNAFENPSGIYFYRLESGSYSQTKKMILVK